MVSLCLPFVNAQKYPQAHKISCFAAVSADWHLAEGNMKIL